MCDLPFPAHDIPCVTFRLAVYELYEKGPVVWKHPELAKEGIIFNKPININDPRTYSFPNPKDGTVICGQDICYLYKGKPTWGDVHSLVEGLFDEWTCEQYIPNEIEKDEENEECRVTISI